MECCCETCLNKLCARKVPIFTSLSEDELQKIVSMTGHKDYKKGEILYHESDISMTLFIINEGKVKLSKLTAEGKEQILHILSTGDFFGELSIFSDDSKNNFNAYAITNVKICTLDKEDMDSIIMTNPKISIKLLSEVTKRLSQTENMAQTLATNDAEIRIAYMLVEFAEKYGKTTTKGTEIKLPINREEMASYIGVTRETISRKLSKMEDDKIIELLDNKTLLVKDINLLKQLS